MVGTCIQGYGETAACFFSRDFQHSDISYDANHTIQKLNIPDGFSPTNASARGWLVDPFGTDDQPMPVAMIFGSCIPAFLVFILIFMESHITEYEVLNLLLLC